MIDKNILSNSWLRRSLAFYIDGFIINVIALLYLYLIDKKGLSVDCEVVFCWNVSRVLFFQLLFYLIYFLSSEFFFLNTIGKKILGFRVKTEENKNLFWRILMRTIIRLIPLNIISFYFDSKKLFWHEVGSKCYTIKNDG